MTGVKFDGRLGNQLFQYVFLKYLKTRRKGLFYFFPNPHHAYFYKYFDLGWYDNLLLGSKLYSAFTRILPAVFRLKEIWFHNWVAPRQVEVRNFSLYKGFFQSDFYYKQIAGQYPLKLKRPYREAFEQKFGKLFTAEKTIVVHIRRTDYMQYGERRKRDISLPMHYFKKVLESIPDQQQYRVIFVSDDMKHVKEVFPPQPNYLFSSESEIMDFQTIQHADIAIISNSTFAWWACYLSPKKQVVYAPENWFGFKIGREHPRGIMTDRFQWVSVPETV